MNHDFNLSFVSKNLSFEIGFCEQTAPSKDTVFVDGHHYKLVGDEFKVLWLKANLPELAGGMTSVDLKDRLVQLGVKDISVSERSNAVGVGILNPMNLPTVQRAASNDVLPIELKEYLERVKSHPAFSGVVTVAWGDAEPMTVVTENSRAQTPAFDASTSFNIMSAGKAFTAVAVMQLVEQEKISLDTPLSEIGLTDRDYELFDADQKYRDDLCPNPDYKEKVSQAITDFRKDGRITIGHLLRHQAGLVDDMSFHGLRFYGKRVGQASYSNYGYQILARVVAKTTGIPFTDYVQKNVLGACGARASAEAVGSEPKPHVCVMGELREHAGSAVPSADGNGCWWMTSGDLLKVAQAFSGGKLCDAGSVGVLTTPVEESEFARGACGMVVAPDASMPAVLFQGTFEGRSAAAFVVTGGEQPLTVSAVFNSIDGSNFWSDMVRIYRGEKVEKPLEGANFTERVEKSKELYERLKTNPPKDKKAMKELLEDYAKVKDFAPDFVPISHKLEADGFANVGKLMREADTELRQGQRIKFPERNALPAFQRLVGESYWDRYIGADVNKDHTMLKDAILAPAADKRQMSADFNRAIASMDKELFLSLFQHQEFYQLYKIVGGENLNIDTPHLRTGPVDVSRPELEADIKAYLKERGFSGIVALSDGEHDLFVRTATIGDDSTPMCIHSVGKVAVGLLVLSLIKAKVIKETELGEKIQLDANVMQALPEKVQQRLKEVTFRDVMTHKSGIGDYLKRYQDAVQDAIKQGKPIPEINSPEDFIFKKYADDEVGEPHYSNLGSLLVGLSAQYHLSKARGVPVTYEEALREFVLDPAGVGLFSSHKPVDAAYNTDDDIAPHIRGGPAGGQWSTAADLLKLGIEVGKRSKEEVFGKLLRDYGGEFWNADKDKPKDGTLWHSGSMGSSSAHLTHFTEQNLTVAVLSTTPGFCQATAVAEAIQDSLIADPLTLSR